MIFFNLKRKKNVSRCEYYKIFLTIELSEGFEIVILCTYSVLHFGHVSSFSDKKNP